MSRGIVKFIIEKTVLLFKGITELATNVSSKQLLRNVFIWRIVTIYSARTFLLFYSLSGSRHSVTVSPKTIFTCPWQLRPVSQPITHWQTIKCRFSGIVLVLLQLMGRPRPIGHAVCHCRPQAQKSRLIQDWHFHANWGQAPLSSLSTSAQLILQHNTAWCL